jgi:hypothetical protein
MYQHQHAPLPLEQLEHVPQAVVILLEVLLEKNPARRFQNPVELLKVMPTVTGAIDAGHRITRQNLQQIHAPTSRVGTRRSSARLGPKQISVARLPVTGAAETASYPRSYRVIDGLEPDRVANYNCQVKKSKAPG